MRTTGLVIVVVAVTVVQGATAQAEELVEAGHRVALDGGYELDFDRHGLRVRHGKRRAPLTVAGTRPRPHHAVTIERTPAAITLGFMPTCFDVSETFTTDQLEARLALADARSSGDPAAALATLRRAHALDPSFVPAADALARALLAAGRLDDAAAALPIPDPVARLVAVNLDPTLAPLRDHPSMTVARADTPGRAALGPTGIGLTAAGDLVVRESLGSHGACRDEVAVVVLDGVTLRERARLPIRAPDDYRGDGCADTQRYTAAGARRIRARQALADRVLEELGTLPAVGERATVTTDWTRHVRKLRFDDADLGLVVGADGAARWFRDGQLIAEHRPGTAPAAGGSLITEPDVVLLPEQRRAIWQEVEGGCEWSEHGRVLAIAMP